MVLYYMRGNILTLVMQAPYFFMSANFFWIFWKNPCQFTGND